MKEFSRHHRQMILREIGREGQRFLDRSRVAVVGLGALGSTSANLMARAGVGTLRLIDRDYLHTKSSGRRFFYDREGAALGLPKAIAVARRLEKMNPEICVEAHVEDVRASTMDELLHGVDLIVDGTDNFETRFLLNDFSLSRKIPWIYGGAFRTEGMSYVIFPDDPPCLRCLFGGTLKREEIQACDHLGPLAPVAHLIASFQATEAIKILSGNQEFVARRLWKADIWNRQFKSISVEHLENLPCSGCSSNEYPYLEKNGAGDSAVALHGRNAVQIYRPDSGFLDLEKLAVRVAAGVHVTFNDYLLNVRAGIYEITVFQDGRTIVKGTEDPGQARELFTRYLAA